LVLGFPSYDEISKTMNEGQMLKISWDGLTGNARKLISGQKILLVKKRIQRT